MSLYINTEKETISEKSGKNLGNLHKQNLNYLISMQNINSN